MKADAVSGASLSLFSSKYFTSDMSKHPALLNSRQVENETCQGNKFEVSHQDQVSMLRHPLLRSVVYVEVLWSCPRVASGT